MSYAVTSYECSQCGHITEKAQVCEECGSTHGEIIHVFYNDDHVAYKIIRAAEVFYNPYGDRSPR